MSSRDGVFGMFGNNFNTRDVMDRDASGINVPYGAAETPQFMIRCSQPLFQSTFAGNFKGTGDDGDYKTNAAPCLHFEIGAAKKNTVDLSGQNYGDGRIVAQTPLVIMKTGSWTPLILDKLTKGQMVEEIQIHRIQSLGTEGIIPVRKYLFESCEFVYFKEGRQDLIAFAFSFVYMQSDVLIYNNDKAGHKKIGNTSMNYDFEEMQVY